MEYNVKFFAAQKHKANWANEVSGYRKTGKHVVIFKRPVRDGGLQSIRKMKHANRVYGTKKRVVSEKVSELSAVYVDEPVDIEPKEEELDPFDGVLRLFPNPKAKEIMLLVVDGDNDVVMHDANDGVQVEHVIEKVMCTDIVDLVFDDAMYKVSECYRKDLEILKLKKLLTLEQMDSKRRVKEACMHANLVWKRWLSSVKISTELFCLPFMVIFSRPAKYHQMRPYNRLNRVNSSSKV